MSPLLFASTASAATCSISNTGPGSNNTCESNGGTSCHVTNSNDIDITNDNSQNAGTGDADASGNTSGGDATSGDASNSSSTSVDVGIDNSGCTTETTTTGGGGSGGGQVMGESTTKQTAKTQVQAPVGGVGAGSGGLATAILGTSVASSLVGVYRLRKLTNAKEN